MRNLEILSKGTIERGCLPDGEEVCRRQDKGEWFSGVRNERKGGRRKRVSILKFGRRPNDWFHCMKFVLVSRLHL